MPENRLAETVRVSEAALALLRLHLERHGQVKVDDATRPLYRELAGAGVMVAVSTYAGGPESAYRMTRLGFERKAELTACAKDDA